MSEVIRQLKGHRKIVALTAYDYPMAQFLSEAGVDILLVGDSLGMVVLGYTSTHFVTMEDMIRHTQAVMRGHKSGLVVADMPIGSCDTPELAIENCKRMVEETGVSAVKIEGNPEVCRIVVEAGIEVMGHTGLKPQLAEKMRIQGKTSVEAEAILEEAMALENSGCFSVVLECVPSDLGRRITEKLSIPTIGIGAGAECDGQILVTHDMLGLFTDFKPKFVKCYANLGEDIVKAISDFKEDVDRGIFPSLDESY
ncbi:MAG: 3-methyl-2-oxobutanoate hydroxymethyltransferase [Candidatus Peregrinibacteria bacterium]|nr:3-methyl-2-oxobutanoate hydroxymethyltransferase [Candidatus Peregrinibacteria bacterium]